MLTDAQSGDAVDVTVSIPAGQGDLLGFFGNLTPETLVPQLRVECSGAVTQFQANTNKVSKVGPGNVMIPVGTWDWGVRLGQNGSGGGGAITTATFRIEAPGLTVASLTGASTQGFVFGVRIQSTLGAEGSAKLGMPAGTPPVGGPPTISITAPASGALLGATPVMVSGSFGGADVSIQVNGVAAAISGSTYSAPVPLVEGENTLTATATNADGSASASVSVTLDTTPPVVTISSPVDGSLTAAESVVVTGTVIDASPIASFALNGQNVALLGGTFTTTVSLNDGANPITAEASDAAGNTGAAGISVTRAIPPSISITSPVDGLLTTETPIPVSGTVSGTVPITVELNGVAAFVDGGSFSASVPLVEGANGLVAVATNAVGSASAQVHVSLVNCLPGTTRSCYHGPPGTAGVGICASGTEICVPDGAGYGLCSETLPAASELCSDGLDNDCNGFADGMDSECASAATALAIAIDSPPSGATVSSLAIDVAGRVSEDAEGVIVNGVAATVSGGTYLARGIAVGPGLNVIGAIATRGTDQASDVSVVLFRPPPVIVITTPADRATLRSASVDVKGVVDDLAAFVEVNGVPARVEANGQFVAPGVPLSPGENTLLAQATNPSGAQGRDDVSVLRDDAAAPRVGIGIRSRGGRLITSVGDYRASISAELGIADPIFDRPIDRISYVGFDPSPLDIFVFTDSADPSQSIGLLGFDGVSQSGEPIPIDRLPEYFGYTGCDPGDQSCPGYSVSAAGRLGFEPVAFRHFQIETGDCNEICRSYFAGPQLLQGQAGSGQAVLEIQLEGDTDEGLTPHLSTTPPVDPYGAFLLAGDRLTVAGSATSYPAALLRDLTWELQEVFGGCTTADGGCPVLEQGSAVIIDGAFQLPEITLPHAGYFGVYIRGRAASGFEFVDAIRFTTDPNAPVVSLVGHQSGEVVTDSHLSLDLDFAAPTVLLSVNGVPDGRSFPAGLASAALELDLAVGVNSIELEFDSGQGARSFAFSLVRVAELLPVKIVSPHAGDLVGGDSVRVSVTVPLGIPGATVNGVTAQPTADPRTFVADVPLRDGAMEIAAQAVPSGGGDQISITGDTRNPRAWVVIPRDGSRTIADSVTVAGFLGEAGTVRLYALDPETGETVAEVASANTQSESDLRALSLLLGGSASIGDLDPSELSLLLSLFEFHRFAIPNVPLFEGVNTFEIVLEDLAGNQTAQLLRFIKSERGLVLSAPADGSSTAAASTALELEAFADLTIESVRVGTDLVGAQSGRRVAPGPVSIASLGLRPGRNEIQIVYRRDGAESSDLLGLSIFSTAPPTTPRVHGRVTADADGAPISGAIVEIRQRQDVHTTATSADGRWSLVLSPGALSATVRAEGYVPFDFTDFVELDDDLTVDVALLSWAQAPAGPLGSGESPLLLTPPPGVTTDWEAVGVFGRLPADATSVLVNGTEAEIRGRDFEARAVPLVLGSNELRAVATYTDGRSGEATLTITRAAEPVHTIEVFSPPAHASIPGGGLVVRGFASAKDARVIVGSGGFAPVRNGVFTITDVFLRAGSATVEAAAQRASAPEVVTDRVPVSVLRANAALVMSASPSVGSPPLTSTLSLAFRDDAFAIARVDFDLDGDGDLDLVAADSAEQTTSFASARPFRPRAWVTMPSGVELSAAARVQLELPAETGAPFAQGSPVDLAPAPGGDLYVLDRDAATVSRYTLDGDLVSSFGSSGSAPGEMSSPEGLAVGPGPRIYVADTGNDRVQVFRGDGTLERTIGSSGVGAGQLYAPRAIALSGDELVVADAGNSRVQALTLDGAAKRSAPLADPRGMDDVPGLGVAIASPMMGLFSFGEASLRSADIASALPEVAALLRPIDVTSGEGLVAIADAGERRLIVLDDGLRLRRVLEVGGPAPVAVLPSSRREVESIFVADGTAVREIRMPVPSPLPVVQALRARLLASDIPGALALIHPLQRGLFDEIYHDIEADLPVDAAAMGAMRVDLVRGDRAIVEMDTVLTIGGVPHATRAPIHLILAEDGTWQVLEY